ncbi:CoB--CoM heterodisulfide reductase iron-sulfur subunit A family protein [Thermodesulforhabdus norvegica]|uniref:Putative adenylylsulfate reductase-associated electron transfer protein QmoA n=1 Tax=Thermodesulforhabdus norvegica TaxID=39841 RepID=A0A1I4V6T2_9BACT|nr:CoB--CoM heterodisulfide reductase iron-sulfur subunit A family protein [Thermodesulforhabdus norvegica]SFM96909.1 putative adenylylsulfate reductase-associated electron transfer protein QmoA [Thermodesulforhabdus norvegica]
MSEATNRSILVVGGGITGLSAAVEAAESGCSVYIVEKEPYLGGRVARMNKYFPKLCPPNCGLEINFRRIKTNPRIRFFTMSEVLKISGSPGNYDVTIRINPRYVNEKCTACGKCEEAAETTIPNPFNYGLDRVKAAYLPHDFAFPLRYVIDPSVVGTEEGERIRAACPYGAVDLDMKPQEFDLNVSALIWATGWQPYDASKLLYYGFGKYSDVITNIMMERYASPDGPTGGKIVRPSTGEPVQKVAFIQCAGSRDENHLPYCSGVCCLASLKQATYVLDQNPDAGVFIYYIDIRALGRYEDFFKKVQKDERVVFIKGKAGEVTLSQSGKPVVQAENQITGEITREEFDLVVLATGMVPSTAESKVPFDVTYDEHGFMLNGNVEAGIIPAGCVKRPVDVATCVQDATAAALKALQMTVRR